MSQNNANRVQNPVRTVPGGRYRTAKSTLSPAVCVPPWRAQPPAWVYDDPRQASSRPRQLRLPLMRR